MKSFTLRDGPARKELAAMDAQGKLEKVGFPREWSPFLSLDDAPDVYEWLKMLLLFPLMIARAVLIVVHLSTLWVVASVKLLGLPSDSISGSKPMPWWRNALFAFAQRVVITSLMTCCGVFVSYKGTQYVRAAKGKEVVAIFNHVSFLDPFCLIRLTAVTGVARAGIDDMPFIGKIGKAMQAVFVARKGLNEKSSTSRKGGTINTLKGRLEHAAHYPLLCIAPEGTTHNGQCVVKFQTGAFALGRPVLPILIKYPYRHFNPAWTFADTGWLLVRLLSQFYTRVEVRVMPLRVPSTEEEKDPAVFASNVQQEMAAALNVPAIDQDLYDGKAIQAAGITVNMWGKVVKVDPRTVTRQSWI